MLADATTNHFDACLTNDPTWIKSCMPCANGAVRFTGPDDWLRSPEFGRAAPASEITVEFWANLGGQGRLFSLAPDDPSNRLAAEVVSASGAIRWQFGRADEGSLEYVPLASLTNTWQHFALVSSRAVPWSRSAEICSSAEPRRRLPNSASGAWRGRRRKSRETLIATCRLSPG